MSGHERLADVTLLGHRGAARRAPENTLAGLDAAADIGVTWVEFDVRLTASGHLVLMHDATLDRTTDDHGPVASRSLASLDTVDAGCRFGPLFAGEPVPTLERALALALERDLELDIEIKPTPEREGESATALHRALAEHWPSSRALPLVTCSDADELGVMLGLLPEVPVGLVLDDLPGDDDFAAAERLDARVLVVPHHDLDGPRAIDLADRSGGRLVWAYTVNERARAEALWDAGVAAVFSDCPDLLLPAADTRDGVAPPAVP